jgi:hypothetical protein
MGYEILNLSVADIYAYVKVWHILCATLVVIFAFFIRIVLKGENKP